MEHWTNWFQESLQQRFYDLTLIVEKQVQAILLLEAEQALERVILKDLLKKTNPSLRIK
jgi:hypothetical protein